MTIPLGASRQCEGVITILGETPVVEELMAEINLFIRNRWHTRIVEETVPVTAKPGPCRGCGN